MALASLVPDTHIAHQMRLSTYTRILPIVKPDGSTFVSHVLLCNGLYGALDVLDAEEASRIARGQSCRDRALERRLLRRGHLCGESPEAEEETLKFLSRFWRLRAQRAISFEISPTYDCNFRCPYCFESHRLAKGDVWLSRRVSAEVLDAFFASIERYQCSGHMVSRVNLYGGEPLLAENLKLVREICARSHELGVPIEAVTNGYDLDAFIDTAVEYEWRDVQVTIDGFGELTDNLRRHRGGSPTYERVMANATALSARGIRTNVRVLVDRERLGRMHEAIEDFRARGLEGEGYNFGYHFAAVRLPRSREREVTPKQILDALVEQGFSFDEARGHVVSYRKAWNYTLRDMKKRGLPSIYPSCCSAIGGRMSVDPDGRVYRCFRAVGRDGEEAGVIDPDGRFVPNANDLLWKMRDAAHLPKCRQCPYVFKCGGGCAANAFEQSGNWFAPHCGNTFELYDFTLPRVVGSTWTEGGDPELTLSWAELLAQIPTADRERFMGLASAREQLALARELGWFERRDALGVVASKGRRES